MQTRPNTIRRRVGYFFTLFTQAKSFRDNPIIGSKILNRLGLHLLRVILAHGIILLRQLALSFLVEREDRRAFFQQGYIVKQNFLDQDSFQKLKAEFEQSLATHAQTRQGNTVTSSILLTEEQLQYFPATRQLLENTYLLNLLRFSSGFFLRPWFYFLRISHQVSAAADPQKTPHADAFHPTMKAWLFLNDIAAGEAPFTYYPGSQKLTFKRLGWEYKNSLHAANNSDLYSARGSLRATERDIRQLALSAPIAFTVPANTLIIANTFGFHHRGPAQSDTIRDSLWASAWRAPFLPVPLPDWRGLRNFFYRRMQNRLDTTQ